MRCVFGWRAAGFCGAILLATPASADFNACPATSSTADAISAWRQDAATALNYGQASDSYVAQRIRQCFPAVPTCMTRMLKYTERDQIANGASDTPYDQDPHRHPPDEFLAPNVGYQAYVIPENIEALAASRGWPTARYKSRHSGGFDPETASLLMVYVAGDKVVPPVTFDRWLNFAIPADYYPNELTPMPQAPLASAASYAAEMNGGIQMPRTFTMVTLERAHDDAPGEVYFQMFGRGGFGNPLFTPNPNVNVTECYSCHPNGLRAISPLGYHVREGEAQLPEEDWKAVRAMNAAMVSSAGTAVVSWRAAIDPSTGSQRSFLNPADQGPIMGPLVPLNPIGRTREFIMGGTLPDGSYLQGCYGVRSTIQVPDIFNRVTARNNIYSLSSQPSIRWEKIRDAMNCESCHNNFRRGGLNAKTSPSLIDFKILVDQSMPFNAHADPLEQGAADLPVRDDMTGDERIALANCLMVEFQREQGQLGKWLTQAACQ